MNKKCPDCGRFMKIDDNFDDVWHCNNTNCRMWKEGLCFTTDSDFIEYKVN